MIPRSICTACGFTGAPKSQIQGSFAVEILLWLCFMVPGLIYSFWRLSSRRPVCPACSRDATIPATTPRGAELIAAAGGWSANAEANYIGAARSAWYGALGWALFAWLWPPLWSAANVPTFATIAGAVAIVMTARVALTYPRART